MVASVWSRSISQDTDPLNVNGKRHVGNTDKSSYNCGGYALECFSWYCPRLEEEYDVFAFDDPEEAQERTNRAVDRMLEDFPTLRKVQTLADVRSDEYAILFRLSSDGDFHYLKRDRGNHWRHKMGNSTRIDTIKTKDIFKRWPCDNWIRYDGPIVILAKKRAA